MKPRLSPKRNAAMTLFEVGIVVAAVVILFVVLTPYSRRDLNAYGKARKIACINNLKQTVLALKIWAGDNGDILPMGISVTNGGSMELAATGNVAATFLAMSNELSPPRVLFCPEDTAHFSTNNFGGLSTASISYFASADRTNDMNPQVILVGDSDLTLAGKLLKPGLAALGTNDPVAWSGRRHNKSGNIGLADGSVDATSTLRLHTYLQQTGLATNRFAIP
jgi:prepilin-type processing-associated H-X9-DG protein